MDKNPKTLDREALEQVAGMFKVFSDATRLEILQSLKPGRRSVGDLVDELEMTQANISKHLRVMFEAKLLNREQEGTSVYYSIDDEFVFPLCELVCDKLNRNHKSQAEVDFFI